MLETILRRMIVAGLIAVLFGPVAAQAEDTTCRNGLFADGEGFRQARVTAKRAFFYEDTDGCPTADACRTRSYVIAGDILVVDGRQGGGFVCAFYPNDGGGTAGWLRMEDLAVLPPDAHPSPQAWLGDWTSNGNPEVTIGEKYGRLSIVGEAYWPDRPEELDWPTIHIGEVAGALDIAGAHAGYADDNLCELELTLLADFLVISDNRQCGGVNVTFSGVYTRAE
ncbi:hypothetical protein [Citromicrobium bathyomarinum]|uniref:hypothetical protein n=1 Tax=Citromicrobium bathyomarinum TaxID=72174 RepID=UPI00315ACF04